MEHEGTPLEEIFGNEAPAEEATPPETIGQPRDEAGRFTAKETGEQAETPQEVTPTSEVSEQSHIPIAALKDERAKRQALENEYRQAAERLQQFEAYFAQQQQPQQEQDPLEIITQQIMGRIQPQTEMQMLTMRVNVAEEFARQKWADYDEKVELFKEAAASNPFLIEELKKAANPAEYAYTASQRIAEAKGYSSAPSREQIEAEMRAKIMEEYGLNKPQVPTSLANAQSKGARSGPAWAGPTSLDDIFKR